MMYFARMRLGILRGVRELTDLERAELALGLSCLVIEARTGDFAIRNGEEYQTQADRFEYFGREEIDAESKLPTDFRELSASGLTAIYLSELVMQRAQEHVDFWFPAFHSARRC